MSPKPKRHKLAEYLEFATQLTRDAGKISLKYFRKDFAVERKADNSPVTIADRETEQFIRDAIMAKYPDHGILGEEQAEHNPGARWRWIVDPLDGTKSFVHGVPLYTTLLALECSGENVLGVIHCPPLDETVSAATGYGCHWDGKPCRVSTVATIEEARLNVTDYNDLLRKYPKFGMALLTRAKVTRGWADAFAYLLVATGRAEIALDPVVELWDLAPLKPIIEEAGGKFTDFNGAPSVHNRSAVATNGLLHDEVLRLIELDKGE